MGLDVNFLCLPIPQIKTKKGRNQSEVLEMSTEGGVMGLSDAILGGGELVE